jgi:hypothetical protein
VVLRIASTAANYFSFPASSLFSGYRLGNITVKHDPNNKSIPYGIVNLKKDGSLEKYPFDYLDLRSSSKNEKEENTDVENLLRESKISKEQINKIKKQKDTVTNTFTYFDCTDYKDKDNGKDVTPVSLATQKQALDFVGYIRLVIDHLILHKIDTHGGYFEGDFTKKLIHKLAFFGFDALLDSYSSADPLSDLDKECEEKQIQVILSPQRIPQPTDDEK